MVEINEKFKIVSLRSVKRQEEIKSKINKNYMLPPGVRKQLPYELNTENQKAQVLMGINREQ